MLSKSFMLLMVIIAYLLSLAQRRKEPQYGNLAGIRRLYSAAPMPKLRPQLGMLDFSSARGIFAARLTV
jgi:hypothetical protein